MEALLRCRALLTTPTSSAPSRRSAYRAGLNYTRWKKPNLEEFDIDGLDVLWLKYCTLKVAEINFKRELLGELGRECQINQEMEEQKKILTLHRNLGVLKEKNVVLSFKSFINQLLSHVEKFPFDSRRLLKYKDENDLTIRHIRNEIERQYLAWKYKVDVVYIKDILQKFSLGFYDYRSLRNMQKNVGELENVDKIYQLSVADKLYFIYQTPFSVKNIKRFQNVCADLKMKIFLPENNKIFQNSHHFILLTLSMLKSMNFKLKQIEEALPFLYLSFPTVLRRLSVLLNNPEFVKYREGDKFLTLLHYPSPVLKTEVTVPNDRFEELVERALSKTEEQAQKRSTASTLMLLVNQFFTVKYSCIAALKKFPNYLCVPEEQVIDTLYFLKSLGICGTELEESITIIFYTRSAIKEVLEKVKSESAVLSKYGYKEGSLDKETDLFKKGTRQRRKILQLCLYYLVKESGFSRVAIPENRN